MSAACNRKAQTKCIVLTVMAMALLIAPAAMAQLYSYGDFEIYSVAGAQAPAKKAESSSLFKLSPKNAINSDGLGGFFVANTADPLDKQQMLLSMRYKYHKLSSSLGTSFHSTESGSVSTLETTVNWAGRWAEWAVTVPLHDWDLSAPRTFGGYATSNTGLGNMKLGWKATYLRDYSYYRFAYGATMSITTGNPERMLPAGSKNSDEMKLYGCVTTSETDRATANLELGTIIDSEGEDDRFIYRLGMSYEATKHVSLIGEVVGEILGGDDKDSMDLVVGARLAGTETFTLELVYYKNLRTFRTYGWDDQLQVGYTLKW